MASNLKKPEPSSKELELMERLVKECKLDGKTRIGFISCVYPEMSLGNSWRTLSRVPVFEQIHKVKLVLFYHDPEMLTKLAPFLEYNDYKFETYKIKEDDDWLTLFNISSSYNSCFINSFF